MDQQKMAPCFKLNIVIAVFDFVVDFIIEMYNKSELNQ